jgi:RNA 2',3'-cyclic 3'-phosphodiesterase
MRAFIGITLAKPIQQKVSRIQAKIKKIGPDVKYVNQGNLHICLRFLGDIDKNQLGAVKRALERGLEGFNPIDLTVGNIGAFPNADHIRVIWVGIGKGLDSLVEKINKELKEEGFDLPENKFRAHITLGRVKTAKNKEKLKELIKSGRGEGRVKVNVKEIQVLSSTLTKAGPFYKQEYVVSL